MPSGASAAVARTSLVLVELARRLKGARYMQLGGKQGDMVDVRLDARFLHTSFLVSHGWVLLYSRRLRSSFTAHISQSRGEMTQDLLNRSTERRGSIFL